MRAVSGNDSIDLWSQKELTANHYAVNAPCVGYIRQRVSFEEHEIGALANLDRTLHLFSSEEFRRINGSGLNCLEGR